MKYVKFLVYVFIIAIVVVLLVQNHEAFYTKVVFKADLVFSKFESAPISVYLVSAMAFTLGLLITWLFFLLERMQMVKKVKKLNNELKEKDKELNSLRNLPLVSENMTPAVHEDDVEFS